MPTLRKRPELGVTGEKPSRWITRAQPKIDRIACPWLIRRFIALHNAAAKKESLPQPNAFVYLTHGSRQCQITCAHVSSHSLRMGL